MSIDLHFWKEVGIITIDIIISLLSIVKEIVMMSHYSDIAPQHAEGDVMHASESVQRTLTSVEKCYNGNRKQSFCKEIISSINIHTKTVWLIFHNF